MDRDHLVPRYGEVFWRSPASDSTAKALNEWLQTKNDTP